MCNVTWEVGGSWKKGKSGASTMRFTRTTSAEKAARRKEDWESNSIGLRRLRGDFSLFAYEDLRATWITLNGFGSQKLSPLNLCPIVASNSRDIPIAFKHVLESKIPIRQDFMVTSIFPKHHNFKINVIE